MALRPKYDSPTDIPETLKEHYVERDGAWCLALEGSDNGGPDLTKLKRAIESERRMKSEVTVQRDEANKAVEALQAKLAELEGKVHDPDKPNAQTQAALKRIEALETAIKAEQDKAKAAEERLAQTRISDLLRQAAQKIGVHPEMIDDVIQLPSVRNAWMLDPDTGNPIAKQGQEPIFGKDAMPISAAEFLQQKLNKAYIQPSSGAGATGGGRTAAGSFVVQRGADHATYMRMKQAAEKAGQTLQVVEG